MGGWTKTNFYLLDKFKNETISLKKSTFSLKNIVEVFYKKTAQNGINYQPVTQVKMWIQ